MTIPQREIIHHGILVNVGGSCIMGYLIEHDQEVSVVGIDIGETVMVINKKKGIILHDGRLVMIPKNCIMPL